MSDTAIKNLREAVVTAAGGGPFALTFTFLTTGLNDSSVTVPADFDKYVQAAFQVTAAADFKVSVSPSDVGAVTGVSFTVKNATIPFIGTAVSSSATLVFSLATNDTLLVVQIMSSPANWTWTTSFAFMGGFPFNKLPVSAVQFIFSTADGKYPWPDSAGRSVSGGAKQNFYASTPLPDIAKPFLSLFTGLTAPTGNLNLSGALDMAAYDGENVLFPSGTLTAAIAQGSFSLLYLTVSDPSITLTIPPPSDPESEDGGDQAPSLSISSGLGISGGGPASYTLQIDLTLPFSSGADTDFSIGLYATGEGAQLTPAAIINLAGNTGSYFSGVPPVLQQFLAFVALQGLSLTGILGKTPSISSIGVQIGSMKGTTWTIIPSPIDFTITSFSLQWMVQNPFDSQNRQTNFTFETQFTILPSVFKGPGGEGNGVFTVQFTSGLQFYAAFAGTAQLSDFLSTVSNGAVSLPSSIQAEVSDITVSLDYTAQSFSFASGFQVALTFLEVDGQAILSISNGKIALSAMTPTQKSETSKALTTASTTVWKSEISGLMAVGPLAANVAIGYDGTLTPARWNLKASLAKPITVQRLIQQFFNTIGVYSFPDFLPGTLTIQTFSINAVIPSGKGDLASSYNIETTFSWTFDFGGQKVGIDPAKILLAYDGAKPKGQQFSGSAVGTWVYEAINLELVMGYKFVPTPEGTNHILFVNWQGFQAEYESGKESITFTLKGWSLGTLIQALVRTLGDPYFTLPAPWDLLNQVSLDGLSISVSLKSGEKNRLSAAYKLSSPLNLGFITINSLIFRRDTDGKVTIAIDGSTAPALKSAFGNLLDPTKGQDVQDMPSVPGQGSQYFKVCLLVLGQRVGITGYQTFETTQEVINALQSVPSTTGKSNPVNPNANQGTPPKGLPYYEAANNWLIAGHLLLLQVAGVWTIDAMVVFNDPNLYGLRLALAGTKAGGLAGLAIDILYKKITDDIGVYQIDFTFPDSIRKLNFGAVSITLPKIAIKVYTNGDFFIDIGFPYNLDFTRSFSIYAIVYGVPVMGSGGLYFGKLSSATAWQVPKTQNGTFNPVIVFGLGLQLGLGYDFTKGPLSAGFSLTVFAIIEGVIAGWNPYTPPPDQELIAAESGLQSQYYFKISGTAGVIGLLYGKVDFAIIQATLNVKITLSIQITYESYRAIPLVATASVEVSLKVKIDLGLFSITISLSFSTTVTAKFVIGADSKAPWDDTPQLVAARAGRLFGGPDEARRRARRLQPRPKRVAASANATKPELHMVAAPQFTVLAPEGATSYSSQQGAFVFLFAMDAPDAQSKSNTGDTSFDKLCGAFFPWVIDALGKPSGEFVELSEAAATVVTRDQLEAYIERLADTDNPPLSIGDLLGFLSSAFTVSIDTPSTAPPQTGSTIFPAFDGLSLSIPDPLGSGSKPIDFETYTGTNSAYRTTVANIFAEVEAVIDKQNQESKQRLRANLDDPESMSAVVFVDSFAMIGRQLLQAAVDALSSYAYKLKTDGTDSIGGIVDWANQAGNTITPEDVAVPNQEHVLTAAIPLTISGLIYSIQSNDTLAKITSAYSDSSGSKRWETTSENLILANGITRALQPNVKFTVQGKDEQGKDVPVEITTGPGATFQQIADTARIPLANLASQSVLYTIENLLTPAQQLGIPAISYTTAAADTLSSVASQFATTVTNLANANLTVAGLFSIAAENGTITIANLTSLAVSDLWTAITLTDQVAQTAGMVSRFLMFGLRLPNASGLTLSGEFLYPSGQSGYSLYQLTGQQFPTQASASTYKVTVSRANQSHGVDLSFVEFNGAPGSNAEVDLSSAYGLLSIVLEWAQGGNFQPSPSFEVLPLSERAAKTFVANTFSFFSTSDVAGLQELTDRGATQQSTSSQPQPILWPLPVSLMNVAQTRQEAIEAAMGSLPAAIPLLPQFKPQVGSSSPASGETEYTDIAAWAWTTRVDFQVKKLPAMKTEELANTGSGSTPEGPASAPSLPNVYEVVGPSSEDGLLLERLLSAMDVLGEQVVSAIFLLYAQANAAATSLVTLADPEFLAFLTQTNLSTETNPERSLRLALAPLDNQPPRGIANSPGEFVKLLWELSVVRSGGYYLFYQVVDGGEGLPASIFDTSGTATLSLVVTYTAQGAASFGNSVTDFVNSFVTTSTIDTSRDIVQVISVKASSASGALAGTGEETLDSIGAIYGPGPGQLAESNPSKPLATGKIIPITGIVRQLQQSDVTDPAKTLANLAAYYSVGAQTPITAQQIQDFNPGVTVALGAVYYIPAIQYVISTAAGPGNTFASISAYYGLAMDEAAVDAREVGGIFPANTTLQIATQLLDLRATIGPRNIGIRLERQNFGVPPQLPENPTPTEKAAYAQAYMYSLYNTLSAGLLGNVYFLVSPLGLPFGPQDQTDGAPAETFGSHAKNAERRRSRLQAAAEADFDYRQTLGFGSNLSKINAAPEPKAPGLPAKSDNPYIGVGGTAEIALRWQDIFGNITITPFEMPPPGYTGAINGSAATILYQDLLTGIEAWPNVKASYIYSAPGNAPELDVNFELDVTSYASNMDQANRDLGIFESVYFQLNQDYTNLGVPGVTGNAVSMSLSNSLLAAPISVLSNAQAQVVRDFVSDCVLYLYALINNTGKVDPPKATLAAPVSLSSLASGNILELDVALTFTRQAALTDPTVAALSQGLSVTSVVLPQADPVPPVAYVAFATAFEKVFQSSDWYMKVGEGLSQAADEQGQLNQQLWAVRFGKAKDQGIYFEIGPTPSYYSPKPLAKSLENQTATIIDYNSGQSQTLNFTGVDLNLWFQTCLDAIDAFLSASYSSSAFILDKILGTADPLKDGYLGKVLAAKQSLADSISARVVPVLSTSATDDSTWWFASEKLRQQLLNQLGAAYAAGAVPVFGLSNVSGAPNTSDPPNLYGQPLGSVTGPAANQNYTLSSAKIPLGPIQVTKDNVTSTYDPRLPFVFVSKNVPDQAYVPLTLNLQISHLEFGRTSVPGIEGYVQSQWLAFVNGPFEYALGSGTSNIPVVNRALPTPPTVQRQSAGKWKDSPASPAELAKWKYSFEYLYQAAAQDSVQVTVDLNLPTDPALRRRLSDDPDMFTPLAQFVSSYPAIARDFNTYLTKIDGEDPDPATIQGATKAVSAFQQYVTAVANAYALIGSQGVAAPSPLPALVEIKFEIALESTQDGFAQTDILNIQIDGIAATWDSTTNTISNGKITLPAMVVSIDPDHYTPQPVIPSPPNVPLAYTYSNKVIIDPNLSYEDARKNPTRTVEISGLDALAYQNAWSSIFVARNRLLFPVADTGSVSTTSYFLFQTPVIKFADPIVPMLTYTSFLLGQVGPANLETLLNNFFSGLFASGTGSIDVGVSMSGSYSYQMLPTIPNVPRIMLPINLLAPVDTPVVPTPPPAFTAPVAETIEDWRKTQDPTVDGGPQINFKLIVFGAAGAQQPLVVVDDLFGPVSS